MMHFKNMMMHFKNILFPVVEKFFLKNVFTIHGLGGHFGHVTWNILYKVPHLEWGILYKIWLRLAKRLQRRRHMKLLMDDDTDAGPWVSYKLTYEPLAQMNLKSIAIGLKFQIII